MTGETEEKDPCSVYTYIRKEEWAEFVKQRNEKSVKERIEIARKAQKRNLHPHYMGRARYVGKLQKWYEEELAEEKLSNPDVDPNNIHEVITTRLQDQSYAWIKAHTPSSSNRPSST